MDMVFCDYVLRYIELFVFACCSRLTVALEFRLVMKNKSVRYSPQASFDVRMMNFFY